MPDQVHHLQLVFINGLRMQFTTRELLLMFARRDSITTILIWAAAIFLIHPFEPEAGYPLEIRVLIWGTLLPLLFAIYLACLLVLGQLFRTGYAFLAHIAAGLSGGLLVPLYALSFSGSNGGERFSVDGMAFTLIASVLLELVMATYLSHAKRLRRERRARAVANQMGTEGAAWRAAAPAPAPAPAATVTPAEVPAAPIADLRTAASAAPAPQTIAEAAAPPPSAAALNPLEPPVELPIELPVALLGRTVLLSELRHVAAEEHYVRLRCLRGQELLRGRISDIEAQLPDSLGRRVHRSHWVAAAAVRRLHRRRDAWLLELDDGSDVPVARARREAVRDWLESESIPH